MKKTSFPATAAILACLCFVASLAFAQESSRKVFGKGNSFKVEELPAGKLKANLQSLDPQAREKAMKWLHTLSFHDFDAADHLRADQDGGIYIVCPDGHGNCDGHSHGPAAPDATNDSPGATESNAPEAAQTTEPPTANVSVSTSSPPVYSSRPGATRHIYLDFNGGIVTGTAWNNNASYGNVASWNVRAWSQDADRTTFNDSEQTWMRRIWQRLAEDYAPFDVNVTTDVVYDPDNYTGNKDLVGWLMICETTDANGVTLPTSGVGGVAYVGVFGNSIYSPTYQPAWVTSTNGGGNEAIVAEAASHEMGHNMGLTHDGTSTLAYYGGHNGTTSAPSWGPIMGTGYNQNVSQWSKGEYYDSRLTGSNPQSSVDDLAIMSARIPYRADDHGNTFASATACVVTNNVISQSGIVERTKDPDTFSFTTGPGAISFTANSFRCDANTWGGNLDIILELYDNSQTLITSSNPAAETNASISTTVATAGTYYLVLKPSAAGTPLASSPSGYTDYGSLGQYTISGTVQPFDPPLGLTVISPSNGNAGSTVTVDISGTKLLANTAVRLKQPGRADIVGTSVEMIGSSLRCQFNLTGAAAGIWNLQATNPDLETATLANAFIVNAVPTTLWSENFDGTVTGWTSQAVSGASNSWSITTAQSHSPTKSYFATGPSSTSVAHLISPSISIPAEPGNLQIEFWHRYDLQPTRDGGRLSLSVDGGAWFDVTSSNSGAAFTLNGYNTAMATIGQTGPFAGLQAWSGINNTFSKTVISLNDIAKYAGKELRIRWEIATNNQTGSNGWYVDSVSLLGAADGPPPNQAPAITVAASTSSAETETDGPTTYQIIRSADTSLSVTATDDAGESYLTYSWVRTSGPAPVGFSVNGNNAAKNTTATFSQAGDYLLTVTALDSGDLSSTSSVNVRVLTTGTYAVTPSNASVQFGATQQFNASLSDQFGTPFASQPSPVNWSTSGGGSINSSGLFTATSAGVPFTVTATSGEYSATASVSVTPAPATVQLSNLNQTYDGNSKPVTVTTNPTPLAYSVTYTGSATPSTTTAPTNAGTYAVVATVTDPNYTGSASGTLVISYAVSYQGNGNTSGTVPAAQTKFQDVNLTLATNGGNLNKTDYSFIGWNTEMDGSGTDYPAGATYSGNASLTLYAKWVPGANGIWVQTTAGPFDWSTAGNWSGGTVAAGADRTAFFTSNFTLDQTVNLDAARTIGNITFTDSTTSSNNLTISGANSLTLSRSGGAPVIDVTQAGRTLTISSQIAGSNGLQKSGAGDLILSGNNNFTGGLVVNAGRIVYSSTTGANVWGDAANVITFTGNATLHNNDGAYTLGRGMAVNNGVTATLTGALGESTNITGPVTGTGDVNVAAGSSGWAVTMSNTANTLSGTVWVASNAGSNTTLAVNSLADGADSTKRLKLGNGTATASLTFTGTAAPIVWNNRALELSGSTGAVSLINNGSAANTVTINPNVIVAASSKTFTLDGSNTGTNTIKGNIGNGSSGSLGIAKSGNGVWALGGTNTYSGATTLNASGTTGILVFQGRQSLSATTSIGITQSSSNVQSLRLLDDGTGTINFARPISFGGGNTTQNLNIFVGNNNTANKGSSSGTTTGSTIQVGNITFTSVATDTNTTTLNATGSNGYRLRTGTITLNNLATRTAGLTTVTALNPTTANMTVDAITMATGNTGIANDGVPVLRLTGTASDNHVTGAISNASDYLAGQALSLQKQGTATWTLSGPNTFTGTTTISEGKLALGANNVLPATTAVSIASAILDAATFTATTGTLDVTSTATINLGTGAALAFADSSAIDWTGGTLNITGTFISGASLRFGTGNTGLTPTQLAKIAGAGLSSFALNGSGYLTASGGSGDNTPPTLAGSDIVDDKSGGPIMADTLVTYTVTFSEDMDASTVTAADFGNAGTAAITIGTVAEALPGVFIVQATPTNGGTLQLMVKAAAVMKDPAGNNLDTSSAILDDTTITVDGTAPTLTSITDDKSGAPITVNTPVTYTVTFSEDMDASTVAAADFGNAGTSSVTIGSVNEITPGVFTVQATPTSEGTLQLRINQAAVLQDLAGNNLDTTSAILDDTTITVDGTAPTLTSITDDKSGAPISVNAPVIYTVTFSEDMDASTVTAAVFGNAGTAAITIGTVAEALPGVFTVQATPTSEGTLQLQINPSAVLQDLAGNSLDTTSAILDDTTITVDGTAPTLTSITDDKSGTPITVNTVVAYTVTFSEDMDASTVTAADFGNAGTSSVTIGTVTETLPGVFIMQATPTSEGTLQLRINPSVVLQDLAGNNLDTTSAILDDTTIIVDGTVPTLTSINDDKSGTPITPITVDTVVTYTVTFSEDMDASTVTVDVFGNAGTSSVTIGSVIEITPDVFTVQATPTTTGTLQLRINPSAVLQDLAGNNLDTTSPILDDTTITVGTVSTVFDSWADGSFANGVLTDKDAAFDLDGGGLATGIEWVVGGDPTTGTDDAANAPTCDVTTDPAYLTFTYRRSDAANEDGNTEINVQYGNDMGEWANAVAGPDIIINEYDNFHGSEPGIDKVEVRIKRTPALGTKLFTRLKVVIAP